MKTVEVTLRSGERCRIAADEELSLMEALRDNGIDEVLALCGGCCSCATCHVILPVEAFAALPAMSNDEDDLLDSSAARVATSRLACQVALKDLPDACPVTVVPEG